MLIKTSELSGAALDWAVAQAVGHECGLIDRDRTIFGCNAADGRQYVIGKISHETVRECLHAQYFRPSTNWAQCGPLVDEFDVWLSSDDDTYCASTHPHVNEYIRTGPTKLIAACRAIVAAKLGDEVEVPDELLSAPM